GDTLCTVGSATENNPKTLDVRDAAEAIRHGLPVVLPTETVFGIGADASSSAALERLWSVGEGSLRQPLAWHIGSVAVLLSTLKDLHHTLSPVQKRLLDKLCPGPVL